MPRVTMMTMVTVGAVVITVVMVAMIQADPDPNAAVMPADISERRARACDENGKAGQQNFHDRGEFRECRPRGGGAQPAAAKSPIKDALRK